MQAKPLASYADERHNLQPRTHRTGGGLPAGTMARRWATALVLLAAIFAAVPATPQHGDLCTCAVRTDAGTRTVIRSAG